MLVVNKSPSCPDELRVGLEEGLFPILTLSAVCSRIP
jgi:hypothetical protein